MNGRTKNFGTTGSTEYTEVLVERESGRATCKESLLGRGAFRSVCSVSSVVPS